MPLKELTIVEIRKRMMEAVASGVAITDVASQFGVTRPTVYALMRRYDPDEVSTLEDRSRAPHRQPTKTAAWIETLLVRERRRWRFGSKKILQRLREEYPRVRWPHRSTVDGIFKRAGLVARRRRRRPHPATPFAQRYQASEPGELWTMDFKGQFRLGNGQYCYPLTIVDSVSRYLIVAHALASTHLGQTWSVIERAFRAHGLPRAVHTDNGPPFGHGNAQLSTMSVRLMKLHIQPIFSRPGKPQDNGAHERMHATLKEHATIPPGKTLRHQQTKLDRFRQMFNHERPHEALAMSRPARVYSPSPRPFPRRPSKIEYDLSFHVRRVSQQGAIKWEGRSIFISSALAGEWIALQPRDYQTHDVFFDRFRIGHIHQKKFI